MHRFAQAFLWIGLVCLILLGPLIKLLLGPDSPPDRASALDRLQAQIEEDGPQNGLVVLKRQAITNEGAYQGLIVAKSNCDGALTIIPLYRNGEAAGILKRYQNTGARVQYLKDGQFSEDYPSVAFWLNRLASRFARTLGYKTHPTLLGVAEWGSCNISEDLRIALSV